MTLTITSAADCQPLNVLGERLCPLTPAGQGLGIEIFETTGPEQVGPPPHRHPWEEFYVVLAGLLEVFDGQVWRQANAGACACISPGQVHAYRNGSTDCRFLTITGPGPAREFFEQLDAEVTSLPPDMDTVLAVAGRHGLEVLPGE
jgi:quercetin dioxygenase-like cupin family protein